MGNESRDESSGDGAEGIRPEGDSPVVNAVERTLEGTVELVLAFMHPVAGPALSIAAAKLFEHRRERAAGVAQAALAFADRDALVRAFETNERFQDLVVAAAEAGSRSSLAEKRVMLGRAVARAATDRAELDESEFIVAALSDLDAPHLQTLKRMATAQERVLRTNETDHEHAAEVASRVFVESHSSVRAALVRHGAVNQYYETQIKSIDGGTIGSTPRVSDDNVRTTVRYAVSGFGNHLLSEVENAVATATSPQEGPLP